MIYSNMAYSDGLYQRLLPKSILMQALPYHVKVYEKRFAYKNYKNAVKDLRKMFRNKEIEALDLALGNVKVFFNDAKVEIRPEFMDYILLNTDEMPNMPAIVKN